MNQKQLPELLTRTFYSETLQMKIVDDYLSSGQTKEAINRKYGIKSHSALDRWLKKFGHVPDTEQKATFRYLTTSNLIPKQQANEQDSNLQEQIARLKQQLEEEQLRSELLGSIIEKAERDYNIPIRKKPNSK